MSLAQKVERPNPRPADSLQPAILGARTAVPLDFRDITRRPAIAVVPAPAAHPDIVSDDTFIEPQPTVRRETDQALDLLNEVANALPFLLGRCADLERDLADAAESAKADVIAANEVAHEWQQIAATLKLQVEGLEKGLKVMKQRAEAAEQKASSLRDETERSQHAAAEAECLSSLFQDKVIASFGAQSLMHPVLEAYRAKNTRPVF